LRRVQGAIARLGFIPNRAAQSLAADRTNIIGLIVPDMSDPFYACCAETIQKTAQENGYSVILMISHGSEQNEAVQIDVLAQHRVGGLLIAPSRPESAKTIRLLQTFPQPVVIFDRPIMRTKLPSITADNREAARDAVLHLIQHGHKAIACLGTQPEVFTVSQRILGYQDAMGRSGLPALVETCGLDHEDIVRIISRLWALKKRPTAIFSTNSPTTMHVFRVLQDLNCHIPDEIALIGFDDFESATMVRPQITVVQQPVQEISAGAARMLFSQIDKSAEIGTGLVEVCAVLRIRQSCGCNGFH
jgi:LacI family transcriptional regulator